MRGRTFWGAVIAFFVLLAFNKGLAEIYDDFGGKKTVDSKMIRPLLPPKQISRQHADLEHSKTQYAKPKKNYCVIQNDDGIPSWYYADFDSGMGFAVYLDPDQCGGDPYPFQITEVHFCLYDPGDYLWPVEIQINIKDLIEGDKCKEPGDSLYSEIHSIPSDSAYPRVINLSLNNPFYVNQPFFLEIVYTKTQNPEHPHPSLLMDDSVTSADTCNNWGLMDGLYYEWCDLWEPPPPGDAILRVAGCTAESCTTLPLHSGWQWISTAVNPDPCQMESIFVNCWAGYLDIIIACDGSFCIPGIGCWIDCWNVNEMYKLHMSDACTIQVCGSKVLTDTPIPLLAGWGCIAYFPECPLEPETALVSVWENLDIVKNDDGEFCIPGVGCWIECMEYNEGYKLHLSCVDTLIYPTDCPLCPPPFAKRNSFPGFVQTTHFSYLGNTGGSYSIVVNSVELVGKHPKVGDEIGVFTPSGLCAGAGVWQGGILGIAVWQNDDRTEIVDGFQVGEQMIFKLWDKSENKEIELSASFERGDGRFGIDHYALVNLKGVSSQLPEKFELAQNYPNPFNPVTKISFNLPEPTKVTLVVYNLLGQKVKTLVEQNMEAGRHEIIWHGEDDAGEPVSTGIYFYRLGAGSYSVAKKMLILK